MRKSMLPLVLVAALGLGGCVASVAAGALGAVMRSASGTESDVDAGPAALEACRARAATLGEVHVIDVERRDGGKAIVWGTVTDAKERRSFECRYDGRIAAFKLRPITGR